MDTQLAWSFYAKKSGCTCGKNEKNWLMTDDHHTQSNEIMFMQVYQLSVILNKMYNWFEAFQ